MSICTPFDCNGLNLNPSKSNTFKNLLTSQFISQTIPLPSLHLSESCKANRKRFQLVTASAAPPLESPKTSFRSKNPKDINVLVVGSTAVAREKSGIKGKNSKDETLGLLSGANACFSDVTRLESLEGSIESLGVSIDVVVSCLANRSGGVKDSWLLDYEATKNSLVVGWKFGAKHFVLLSAICVQKPLLEFQRAKLKFEAELIEEAERDEWFN
ncbi:hypothetical protein SASPL_103748 [Salvia splendens]|uniref:Divinyl chlorophyllide a 8-vinyl-reductase, chloroplastic n=1 Tax=Salvia splendens TaxID=180675 RepID=A0A8X8YIM9_SALSN|nr:hypothetical protein SASPL_103748 [Salvia splendens]